MCNCIPESVENTFEPQILVRRLRIHVPIRHIWVRVINFESRNEYYTTPLAMPADRQIRHSGSSHGRHLVGRNVH
jgi:hypothetical protein